MVVSMGRSIRPRRYVQTHPQEIIRLKLLYQCDVLNQGNVLCPGQGLSPEEKAVAKGEIFGIDAVITY